MSCKKKHSKTFTLYLVYSSEFLMIAIIKVLSSDVLFSRLNIFADKPIVLKIVNDGQHNKESGYSNGDFEIYDGNFIYNFCLQMIPIPINKCLQNCINLYEIYFDTDSLKYYFTIMIMDGFGCETEPRLQVKALHKNVIALVITGCIRRGIFIIPRITLIQTDYPFEFNNTISTQNLLCYMTINNSKGQSLSMAGIGLREECFSHGQFYIAFFRVSCASSLYKKNLGFHLRLLLPGQRRMGQLVTNNLITLVHICSVAVLATQHLCAVFLQRYDSTTIKSVVVV
ncbi:ATP-dependent DNA helicase PIF1-like [Aphis craccivora]|uniref:ATP-dependent DNA helicase PIF1-like n=1 Tax=Aphis craccivora TaxID=307492 RepID=A0A6G0Z7I3_APHCR|nr:ATP-dependent DNA helicase PIF1-like [Aphis craccivora]